MAYASITLLICTASFSKNNTYIRCTSISYNNNMLIVQYPMQFSYLLEILATHVQHRFAQFGGSTDTTRVHAFHALLLSSIPYLLYGRRPGYPPR